MASPGNTLLKQLRGHPRVAHSPARQGAVLVRPPRGSRRQVARSAAELPPDTEALQVHLGRPLAVQENSAVLLPCQGNESDVLYAGQADSVGGAQPDSNAPGLCPEHAETDYVAARRSVSRAQASLRGNRVSKWSAPCSAARQATACQRREPVRCRVVLAVTAP